MAFFKPTRCLHAIVSLSTSTTTTKFQQIRRSYNPNIFVENLLDFTTFWCNEKLRFADNVFAFFSQSFSLRYSGKVSITWPEVPCWLNGRSCVSRIEPKTNTQTKKQNWTIAINPSGSQHLVQTAKNTRTEIDSTLLLLRSGLGRSVLAGP